MIDNLITYIKTGHVDQVTVPEWEYLLKKYPYFQSAQMLYLKKLYKEEHYKYNHTLKTVAAHTINRTLLFDWVTAFDQPDIQKKKVDKFENNTLPAPVTIAQIIKETVDSPIDFKTTDKHSFQQWLQLKTPQPIQRELVKTTSTITPSKVDTGKAALINHFIESNPKISPIKKTGAPTTPILKVSNEISNELMTQTLAKVYIAQKKYAKAIQAYEILSLKYPEKSSLFADQIDRIKILQNQK